MNESIEFQKCEISNNLFGKLVIKKKNDLVLSKDCGQLIRTFKGHWGTVKSIQVDDKSNKFISASRDKKIKIWDYKTGDCLKTINEHECMVICLLIPNDKFISSSESKTIKIWDLNTYECLNTIENESQVCSLCLISDNQIAFSCYDGSLNILNLDTLTKTKVKSFKHEDFGEAKDDDSYYDCCLFDVNLAYQSKLIGNSIKNKIIIWNLDTYECIKVLKGHSDMIFHLELTSDGNLFSCSEDQSLKLWDLETGDLLKSINFGHPVQCVKPLNEDLIAIGLGDYEIGYIIIYNLAKMEIVKQTRSFPIYIYDLYLLQNGNLLSGSGNGFMNEWKIFD